MASTVKVYTPKSLLVLCQSGIRVEISVIDEGRYAEEPVYGIMLEDGNEDYNYWFKNLFEGIEWLMEKIDDDEFDGIWKWYLNYDRQRE